jgi:hypothetical protein
MRRVFLSHSSKNLAEVIRFDCHLRRHGVPLWRDRVDMAKGAATEEEIRRAGDEALGFTFYLTKDAAESEWVRVKELGHAVRNAGLDNSFGIVPVFRDERNAIADLILSAAKAGEPKYDLRKHNGHVVKAADDLELEADLAAAADAVLRSSLRTLRKHAAAGSRLRIAAVTRHTSPWNGTATDLAIDWSHLYPPTGGRLPDNGVGATQLLPPLQRLVTAVVQEWKEQRVQVVPHCHPSLAVATGFALRRGSGFDLEVLDHASGARLLGPARPQAPIAGLWVESMNEPHATSRDIALAIGVSRDVAADAVRTLAEHGVDIGAVVSLTPPGGPSNAALPTTDCGSFHRLAVAAVQRVVELQSRRGVGVVHLFLAVPGTLAVLLGQQLTNLGIVQVYDFDNDRRKYAPVFTLTHS